MAAAWGAGIFHDDLASDFAVEIAESDGLAVLQSALAEAGHAKGHLHYEFAVRALIAAEVLAALGGRPTAALPPELQSWVAGHRNEATPEVLWPLARAAVERVEQDSEISELWARSNDFGCWIEKVDDLLARLAGAAQAGASLG